MDTMSVDVAAARSTASIANARKRTRALLDGLVRPIGAEAADTVVLVVPELVTNALRHVDGTCTLDLTAHPDSIEVAVHDPSPQVPRMRTPDLNGGTGGFGWPTVNRFSRATDVTAAPSDGKTVCAFLPRWPAPQHVPHSAALPR
ncbi:ATP-binding protein [Streptomyces sp. NPDC021356]|uniref:ATP-binding protein n=1 Tax=Streptomyces sp. NPDC021356 TaxID=3154900 RepID=UPI0033DCF528